MTSLLIYDTRVSSGSLSFYWFTHLGANFEKLSVSGRHQLMRLSGFSGQCGHQVHLPRRLLHVVLPFLGLNLLWGFALGCEG